MYIITHSSFFSDIISIMASFTMVTGSFGSSYTRRRRIPLCTASASLSFPSPNSYLEVMKLARQNFAQEVSFRSNDNNISVVKALLYISMEDEALASFHGHNKTSLSFQKDKINILNEIHVSGRNISQWLSEFDVITNEVKAELVEREIGCDLVQVIEAVNTVLFDLRGFRRFPLLVDSSYSYLHSVLLSGCGTAIMLSLIYMEIFKRLGLSMVGSPIGEDFLIWPLTQNPDELFKVTSGHNLLSVINGRCIEDPKSRASDLNSQSLLKLDFATNRDIIGICLANLIRLHWKRASKGNHGLMLISPLRPEEQTINFLQVPCFNAVELQLAIIAAERLLLLQPDKWTLRRDYGMLLYYARRHDEAVQELSICMAFAPVEEVELLELFVVKLHLMRQFSALQPDSFTLCD